MVCVMSPETARLAGTALFCLIAGGAAGAYGASRLTSETTLSLDPGVKTACPKCETCPVCPKAPDCGELGVVPVRAEDDMPAEPIDLPEYDEPDPEALPGLPPRALSLASKTMMEAVQPCLQRSIDDGERGIVVLALTVTATGGVGFFSEAKVVTHDGEVDGARECSVKSSRKARFDWDGADGRQDLRLPLEVGDAVSP